jgi:hypothetical protein
MISQSKQADLERNMRACQLPIIDSEIIYLFLSNPISGLHLYLVHARSRF